MDRLRSLKTLTALTALTALAAFGAGLALPSAGAASSEPGTLVLVDEDPVTTSDLIELLALQRRSAGDASEVRHLSPEGVLRRLIQNRLLEHEGYRLGAEETPAVRNQVWELVRHRSMIALLDSVSASDRASDLAELGPTLDRTNTIFRVSHILVSEEIFAVSLLDSLSAGTPFADLARRHSQDTTTASIGGDLGWARSDLYIPAFRDVLEDLPKGGFGGPARTERGWHLLELTDRRTETVGQSSAMRDALEDAAKAERVMNTVRAYVDSLKEKYGVTVDDSLLATLDYASADPAVQEELSGNEEVLVTFPWRKLTVRELTRRIRFEHFHGIEDKPDAEEIRDTTLDEWVTELLLRHEAGVLGFDRRPEIVDAAQRMKRELVREVAVNKILDFDFDPPAEEIAAYWSDHPEQFTPTPRVRAEGVHLQDEPSARALREALESGAKMAWLAERAPGVADGKPAVYSDWIDLELLGLSAGTVEVGMIVGPFEAEGIWVVARILQVESVAPIPLEQSQDRALRLMRRDRTRDTMSRALDQLESAATIEIADGALDTTSTYIDEWLGASASASVAGDRP